MIIDTHCHLNMGELANNTTQIIQNAKNSGVKYMQSICTDLKELPDILAIAEAFPEVFASVGQHPCNTVAENVPSAEKLIKLAKHPKIIGFGETGLDYYHPNQDKAAQIESFINHIKAAQEAKLPIIVHTRDAEEDTYKILNSEMKNEEYSGVIHCFTASQNFAHKALDLGFYISIAGIVTFKNATALQDIVKNLPLDRILVETDAPYLAPVPMRGKPNEPSYVRHTVEFIARLRDIPIEEMMQITTCNAQTLFSKAKFV